MKYVWPGTSYFDIFIYKTWDSIITHFWWIIFKYGKWNYFTACWSIFCIFPTQNLQFFGTLFLLFCVLLIPSLTIFVSLRQRRWRLLSTISQQYRWTPRCVSAPPSFINVHLFITGLCTIYIRDAHCACHKESFFIVNSKELA